MIEECRKYFKGNKGYSRALEEMRKKWKQYGRVGGVIEIIEPTPDEIRNLSSFFGKELIVKTSDKKRSIKFSMGDFEKALSETKFVGITLKELLEAYFSEELITNKDEKINKEKARGDFFLALLDKISSTGLCKNSYFWLESLVNSKRYGYSAVISEYETSEKKAEEIILSVCSAIDYLENYNFATLEKRKIPLASLGAEITSNPHYFDRTGVSGRLLFSALSMLLKVDEPQNAEEVLEVYYKYGIRTDDISSNVTAYGITLFTSSGTHPAYEGFISEGEYYTINLANLGNIVRAESRNKKVYVIENQMVFSHMCDAMKGIDIAMICTSGQVRTAALILIDLLCKSDCVIYYSGDIDPEGLSIADRIVGRCPEKIIPWRMGVEDYYKSISNEVPSEQRIKQLDKLKSPPLVEVAKILKEENRCAYQEHLINDMLEDMRTQV